MAVVLRRGGGWGVDAACVASNKHSARPRKGVESQVTEEYRLVYTENSQHVPI